MKEGGRGSGGPRASRVRSGLIVAELALSLILLAGAGLLIRSFARLAAVDPGFRVDHLLVLSLQLPESRYRGLAQSNQFARDVLERVRGIPGVTAAGSSNNMPFLGGMGFPLLIPGHAYTQMNALQGVQVSAVTEDYFSAQGLRLRAGRAFSAGDRAGAEPVIILNEAAVKKFLPAGAGPLDQRVMLGIPANLMAPGLLPTGLDKFVWSRVVGVVDSSRYFGLDGSPTPAAYIPIGQNWDSPAVHGQMFLLVRTAGDPARIGAQARAAVSAVDPDEPVSQALVMEQVVENSLRPSRFIMVLLGLFAAVASTLAAVGIYGVVAWSVARRTRELGIRAALGATRADVVRLVLSQSMRVVLLGLLLGLGGALALSRLLRSLLFETSVFDPWTFAAVAIGLGAVGLLASFGPAIRASRISPLEAFRAE
jgi:putative ABC transport system permease protein